MNQNQQIGGSSVDRAFGSESEGGKAGSNRRVAVSHFYFSFLRITLFTPKVINLMLFFLDVKLGLLILAGFLAI